MKFWRVWRVLIVLKERRVEIIYSDNGVYNLG